MSKKTLIASFIFGLAVICAQPKSLSAATPTLTGVWNLVFEPTSPNVLPNIPGLATFSADGTLQETDGAEAAPGSINAGTITTYGTPGHGHWEAFPSGTGFFILFDSLNVNSDATLNSRRTTQAAVTVSAGTGGAATLSGTYTTTVAMPDGGGTVTQSGNIKGNFVPAPALP